jgi:biopolymer transport protein ExbB
MSFFEQILSAIKLGGVMVYPLSLLSIVALALIFDKILFYQKLVQLPKKLLDLIETYNFSWSELELELSKLEPKNIYGNFFTVILQNKTRPIWWLESRVADEAKLSEKKLNQSLWILETITTAAPLLGLLGTIIGMMGSFKLMGENTLVNPSGITGGVAEALIATAFGLGIAIFSLFAFNYFSRRQDQTLDELERLGSRIIDHIKIDQ